MSKKHLFGLGAVAVLALVVFAAFGAQKTTSVSASPLDIQVNGVANGTVTVNNGDTITIKTTNNQPFSTFTISGTGGWNTGACTTAAGDAAAAVRAAITNLVLVSATEDTLASNPTNVTASMGADTDGSATNGCAQFTGPAVVIAGTNLNMTLTAKVNCPNADVTGLKITSHQNLNGALDSLVSITCKVTGANGPTNVLSIAKVDQTGGLQRAQFVVQVETGVGSGVWTTIATMNTSNTSTSTNPCLSTNASCTLNPSTINAGNLPPSTTAVAPAIPSGQAVRIIESVQPANCTLVQILDGDGDLIVQPVVLTFPARTNDATLKFINSCVVPGGPNAAGSSVAVVVGGATFGLSNSTHIEIIPAPGSDDDARLDIRVRDVNNVPLVGAHVTVSIDKGALAMRTDTSSSVAISGYEVIEPSAPNFGTNVSGDTCDQGILQATTSNGAIYNGTNTNPFISTSRMIQDSFTNVDGILSACVYVNPDLAPGITPGKITATIVIEQPTPYTFSPYGSQNLILTATITVVGPPASIKVAASPTSVQCGEKSTITATVTDSVGQNVSDHTRVELVSNFGATIGGTGSTLGFPGVGAVNPLSSSAAETFSGVATAFLLTSTEHVGPYEVVVASGGSVGGVLSTPLNTNGAPQATGLTYQTGVFSTAPVSAQVTVTCALPVVAAAVPPAVAPVVAPRTGEGIRPPNTGDAGLADASGNSSTLFIVAGLVAFAVAGLSLKLARR